MFSPTVTQGVRVQYFAACDGALRRVGAEDEALARQSGDRRFESQLHEARRARRYLARLFQRRDARQNFRRAEVNSHSLSGAECARRGLQDFDARIQHLSRRQTSGRRKQHPALDARRLDSSEVDRRPLSRSRRPHARAVYLQAAHAHARSLRQQFQFLSLRKLSGDERAGHDRAEAAHREGAIHRKTRDSLGRTLRHCERDAAQYALQLFEPRAGACAHGDDGRGFEKRARDQLRRLCAHQFKEFFVHRVRLGDDDEAGLNFKQRADVEVLARLRHNPFVGGDDQSNRVNAVRAREHVLDEALMAGHVHEPDAHVAQVEFRKAEVNRDAAPFLFRQTICIHARQSAHQRRLTVINVPGCADDDGAHKKIDCEW
jgi:hypothetical protein